MWFWRVFEATTTSGLRLLLAILAAVRDLRIGVALVVENFFGAALGVSTWISQVCWRVVAWTFHFVRSNLVRPFFIVILVILR
jgi:hypothetical protein